MTLLTSDSPQTRGDPLGGGGPPCLCHTETDANITIVVLGEGREILHFESQQIRTKEFSLTNSSTPDYYETCLSVPF